MKVSKKTIPHAIDPSVNAKRLSSLPGIPNNGRLADIGHLLDHVEFTEMIKPDRIVFETA
jgi:hypothetical protein